LSLMGGHFKWLFFTPHGGSLQVIFFGLPRVLFLCFSSSQVLIFPLFSC
jgi:hypothetical protein